MLLPQKHKLIQPPTQRISPENSPVPISLGIKTVLLVVAVVVGSIVTTGVWRALIEAGGFAALCLLHWHRAAS
ncbi:hypothetical protein NFHSH190041_17790 [Shewanella sp. NFH-SH190041]|nr:hypothetical protein NFHSH190041_17790 [Shewanella sp. NFH-SH190041]